MDTEAAGHDSIDVSRALPVLAVRGNIAYPGQVLAVPLPDPADLARVRARESGDLLVQLLEPERGEASDRGSEGPAPPDAAARPVGVTARVLTHFSGEDGAQVVLQGIARVEIVSTEGDAGSRRAFVLPFTGITEPPADLHDLSGLVLRGFRSLVDLDDQLSPELGRMAERKRLDPARLADFVAASLPFSAADRQAVVEMPRVSDRLHRVADVLDRKLEALKLRLQIQGQARVRLETEQRRRLLREQLKEIHAALGETAEIDVPARFRDQLRDRSLPEAVREIAEAEIHRLENLSPASVEHDVTRHHLDALLHVPWEMPGRTGIDLEAFERALEVELVGLTRAKSDIVEHIAVQKLNQNLPGPALGIVGPPGVGRTAIARAIARGLDRPLVRIDLESLDSAAELIGLRQTAVGAEPGILVRGLSDAGVMNPVILLNGLDLLGEDVAPQMIRAVLSILDPVRRTVFMDEFLRVPIDLGGALVLATAATPYAIPEPFVDSLETVTAFSYIDADKLEIARRHLIPEQLARHGLSRGGVRWSDAALLHLIQRYTREPGVWQLNRALGMLCRKLARETTRGRPLPDPLTPADVVRYLGQPRIPLRGTVRADEVGTGIGLAWTTDGGDILPIEAIRLPGAGEVQLTGQLGDILRESAAAALSFVRSRSADLEIPPQAFNESGLHINLPEGAIPKDGPSAGVTLAVVIASLMTNRPVRHDVAMTGEITLRGRILPVGGIREKILGAHRAGIRTVVFPAENVPDLEDVPEPVVREMRLVPVETADQALEEGLAHAVVPSPCERRIYRGPGGAPEARQPAAAAVRRPRRGAPRRK